MSRLLSSVIRRHHALNFQLKSKHLVTLTTSAVLNKNIGLKKNEITENRLQHSPAERSFVEEQEVNNMNM